MTWAADYIGIPYAPHGRDRTGADCWGLISLIYKEQRGIELNNLCDGYSFGETRRGTTNSINAAFKEEASKWQKIDKPQVFDVAAFAIHGMVYHVGLVLDSQFMIHIENKAGSCLEKHNRKDFYGYYRYI